MALPDFDTLEEVKPKSSLPDFDSLKPLDQPAAAALVPPLNPNTPQADFSKLDLNKIAADDAAAKEYTQSLKDTGFTQATGGGLPGLFAKGMGALSEKVIEPLAARALNNAANPLGLKAFPKFEAGKSIIPDSWLPLANEKGFIPALTRTLKGITTPGSLVTLPMALESKPVQQMFLSSMVSSVPDSIQQLAAAKSPDDIRDAATSIGINVLFAGALAKGLKSGELKPSPIENKPQPQEQNAKGIRSDTGQPSQAGQVVEGVKNGSGEDLQQPPSKQPESVEPGTQISPRPHDENARQPVTPEIKEQLRPKPDWEVNVQKYPPLPNGQEIPSHVQLVDPSDIGHKGTGGNQVVATVDSVRNAGHEVPDFSKLPAGKYNYAEAVKALDQLKRDAAQKPPVAETQSTLGKAEPAKVTNKGAETLAKPTNLAQLTKIKYTIRPNGNFDVSLHTDYEGSKIAGANAPGLEHNLTYDQLVKKVGKPLADAIKGHSGEHLPDEIPGWKSGQFDLTKQKSSAPDLTAVQPLPVTQDKSAEPRVKAGGGVEPLGLNRPSVQNPSLRNLSDSDFDAEFKSAKKSVNQAEKKIDDAGDIDSLTPQQRKEIGAAQDRWEAANLERFRRNTKDTVPEDLFYKLKELAGNAVKFGKDSSQHQKAKIIMEELQRQGATPDEMLAGIKLSSPDAAEVFKADLEDIKKLSKEPQVESVTPLEPQSGKPIEKSSTEAKPAAQKFRVGRSPQPYTLVEELPQTDLEKQYGEKFYRLKNDKTGDVETFSNKDLKPIKERTTEEKSQSSKTTVAEKLKSLGYSSSEIAAMSKAGAKALADRGQPKMVALGADILGGEYPKGQGSPTAMKYRLIDQERQQRGLEPLAKPAGVSDQAVMDKAISEVDRDPSLPDKLVSELNKKPRSIDAWERMVLLLHKIDLRHEFEKSANEAAQAFDDSKEFPERHDDMVAANLRTADLSDQLTKLENASRVSGSEQGRGLRSLRIMANEDYSLASLETQRRAAKGGEPLTDSERADLKKIADDYKKANDELTAHLAAARLRISSLEAGKVLDSVQNTPRAPKGTDIAGQKVRLQKTIGDKLKSGKLDEVTNPIQKLARLFVQSGISDRDALIDAVHGVLKDIDPSITRRDTMDAISGYGDFKQLSKDEVSVKLRGMKGEMQQIAKLEDMAKGVPPSKTGVERRTPTEAERKLIKAVNEAKIKFQVPITDPLTQLKSALDTRKIQLQRQIEEMQEKMATGNFEKAPRRELVLDRRAQELQAEKERVAKKFKKQQADYQKSTAQSSSKFLDFISNLRRFSVLSGVNVIGKLAAYSATKLPTIAGTEAIGGALGKIPGVGQVFEKAPSEGGFSAKAISNSIAKGLTQGFVDAYKTATKGQSDLRAAYSNRIESGREWYNFFQTVHEVVKSPLRRAAFELSLSKRMDYAQRHGADITDPLTQLALSKDAYLDSDRALLLENNRLANGIRGLFKQLEMKDKKTGQVPLSGKLAATAGRVELPILSVPLNYVKQAMTSAFGLVSGSVKLRRAFANGIENLKPEEADEIARHLKYGTIGGAMLLYGFIDGYKNGANGTFGGFYQPGEKRKDNQAGVGGIRVEGHNIPGLALHNPVIAVAQMGHTMGAILASKVNNKSSQTHSLPVSAAAGLMGLLNQSPLGNTVEVASQLSDPRSSEWAMGEHVKGLVDPQLAQEIAQWTDKNSSGQTVKRDPKTITQHVETGIPVLRKNVPEKKP